MAIEHEPLQYRESKVPPVISTALFPLIELMPALTLWKVPPLILPLVIVSRPFSPNSPPVILALVISTGQLMGTLLSALKSKSAPP